MMSRWPNFETPTAPQGRCAARLRRGHPQLGPQTLIAPTTPPLADLAAAAIMGGSLSPKRYPGSIQDFGSERVNR